MYTVALELPGLTVSGERISDRASAEQLKEACQGAAVTIKKVECKEKSEKPPALYDLTTLQRDANRLLGFTAQQTLDYLQSLYEKKLCTYPRTDSRYLTGDMADSLPVLVNLVANAMPFRKGIAITCDPQTVINDKKVTDHHAVIPTRNLKDADLSALPAGEKAVLELVALRLLCAVAQPHIYSETVVIAACAGGEFTAKGKTVRHPGWKALEDAYRAKTKDAEPKKEGAEKALPELTEGQTLSVSVAIVKEGKSSPPQHFTEDKQRAREILQEMDLLPYEDCHPMGLSGGQKQRVAVASAIASERPMILFDEPTSGLDLFHMRQVANVVNQVANTGRTALVVTHDPEFILRCCNYVLHLEKGQIQESYSIEDSDGRKRLLKFFLSDMKKEVSTE